MRKYNTKELINRMIEGDEVATARLISLIENYDLGPEIIPLIHRNENNNYIIGITGPPGVGKSSLTEKIVLHLRSLDYKVGIIAIDPTSPFTGGALLGDRIRLQQLTTDPGVFIRSMASRGSLGGISAATLDAVKVLEAYGCDYIIVETVGVGQSEVEIVKHVDTTLLVLSPGLGDDIQALKAGVMEIADVFAVNKADLAGVEKTVSEIELMQHYNSESAFTPPIVKTIARDNVGIEELYEAIVKHREHLKESGEGVAKRRERVKFELWHRINSILSDRILKVFNSNDTESIISEIYSKNTDSYSVAEKLIKEALTPTLTESKD
ncbi:MAG: methylmalonyl Co-A mutase-associated GTPase MeaB [Candidatus Cloacimonas sp.]|jgi:LAO/AO transport system kinase|nr:methylmalonyl Co-A mutase-associated GTPase MeaB [Candidatus Cloacimonadota bacterium]